MKLFAALRSVVYAVIFIFLWGWLALGVRAAFGELLHLPDYRVTGIICMSLGCLIAGWCVGQFSIAGNGTPAPFDAPRKLVISGPFRYVRNPMYYGGGLLLCGFSLLKQSATIAVFTIGFLVLAHLFVVFYEEPTLKARFGEEYRQYCGRVHRWWPTYHSQ